MGRPPGSIEEVALSFAAVDSSASPGSFVDYLDGTTRGQWGFKNYVAATFELHAGGAPVLDVGCGTGSDLILLRDRAGVTGIGIDASQVMAETARQRGVDICVASGEALPFRDEAFGGCRIERVLMHTVNPLDLLHEIRRCVRPSGLVTMLEPDWLSFTVAERDGLRNCGWLNSSRQPGVGAQLWDLAEAAGLQVLDQVEELSVWRSLDDLEAIVGGASVAVAKAIAAGRVDEHNGRAWLEEQSQREGRGEFHARMRKILVVARRLGAA